MPQGNEDEKKLNERLAILRKRRQGAGSMIGGMKERNERIRLVESDISDVEKKLKKLRSLQGRVRSRREAEKEAGVERGG